MTMPEGDLSARVDAALYYLREVAFATRRGPGGDGGGALWRLVQVLEEVRAAVAELQQLRALSIRGEVVREEERVRISRQIHDELGHVLTGLKLDVAWAERRLDETPPSATVGLLRERLRTMSGQVDAVIQTVRRIATDLRPGVLDELGLVPAIEWQTHDFQMRSGIPCDLVAEVRDLAIDADRSTAMFRIFQEILTNVARHARATRVEIRIGVHAGKIVLDVQDNGGGITEDEVSDPKSLGILGMRERARQWGGDVAIHGVPLEGTAVVVRMPIAGSGAS